MRRPGKRCRSSIPSIPPTGTNDFLVLYPKVVEEFCRHRQEYGYIMRMGSHVFFNGMALGETNKINIEDGKTLSYQVPGPGRSE